MLSNRKLNLRRRRFRAGRAAGSCAPRCVLATRALAHILGRRATISTRSITAIGRGGFPLAGPSPLCFTFQMRMSSSITTFPRVAGGVHPEGSTGYVAGDGGRETDKTSHVMRASSHAGAAAAIAGRVGGCGAVRVAQPDFDRRSGVCNYSTASRRRRTRRGRPAGDHPRRTARRLAATFARRRCSTTASTTGEPRRRHQHRLSWPDHRAGPRRDAQRGDVVAHRPEPDHLCRRSAAVCDSRWSSMSYAINLGIPRSDTATRRRIYCTETVRVAHQLDFCVPLSTGLGVFTRCEHDALRTAYGRSAGGTVRTTAYDDYQAATIALLDGVRGMAGKDFDVSDLNNRRPECRCTCGVDRAQRGKRERCASSRCKTK